MVAYSVSQSVSFQVICHFGFVLLHYVHCIIVQEGESITLLCDNIPSEYPGWRGPPNDNIYSYTGDTVLNSYFGEKINILSWDPANNKNLIVRNVMKNASGIYTCHDGGSYPEEKHNLSVRVLPKSLNISNQESLNDKRTVVRGTQDQPVELRCTSTGGYPKPYLKWYRGNNQTDSLNSLETFETNSDGNYIVVEKYTFKPTRLDDRVSFLCQSSFDQPQPSYQSHLILLYLNLKPTVPSVTTYSVIEGVSNKVAECTTSQFRPNRTQVWFQKEGNNVSIVSNITYAKDDVNETFSLTASYSVSLTRESNGNNLVCYIAHETLQTLLTGSGTIAVNFRPLTVQLTGATSNIFADDTNTLSLTCTSGTSYPRSTIKWFRNNQEVVSNASVQEADGAYNGNITSQILEFVPDRGMDGQEVYCIVHNSVDEQHPIRSASKTMDLLYHPVVYLSDGGEVTEGQDKTLKCEANAKPNPSFTWYHNEFNITSNSVGSGNMSELILQKVNRTNAGQYKCVADNGYEPDGVNLTTVSVKYTPDVAVTTRNVTVNDSTAELVCTAAGVPSVYTYSEWQHTWPDYGSITHTVKLGNKPTLTLVSLTYEYSGVYTCTVSNGVSGSVNPNAGYGKAYLKIETYPIITTLSSKKVSAQLNMSTSTTIHFYSNRNDNKVKCYRGESKHDCSFVIQTETINLPVFDSVLQTEGLAANITLAIQHIDHFGAVTILISNGIGETPIDITVVPEGPPESPYSIEIGDISSTSVTISWIPGFHGGFDQTFLIQYSTNADTWDQYNNETIYGGKNEGLLNTSITGLQSGTRHYVRLLAYTMKGNSSYTDVYNFSTAFQVSGTKKTTSDIMAIVAGVAATGVVALIACSVVLVLVVRYRRKKGSRKEQSRRSLHGDENIYDEDGMEINQAYESAESLGIQPSSTTDGASNIYAQVDKSKKQTMQREDNTYSVVDKSKKKDDTLIGQTDIYATPMKKKDKKQTKNNYQKKKGKKDKKDKGNKRTGDDVYENAQELDLYRNVDQTDEKTDANLYHNGDENIQYKRNLNKDGLLYADLAFDNNTKRQKNVVIHGLENATDYVEVDFNKKAEPLPERDEEACNSQNNV